MVQKRKKKAAVQTPAEVLRAHPRYHLSSVSNSMYKYLQNEEEAQDTTKFATPTWCYVSLLAFVLPNALGYAIACMLVPMS